MKKTIIYKGKGFKTLIDKEDEELYNQYNWYILIDKNTYYVQGRKKKTSDKMILFHKLLMNSKQGEEIDHKNYRGWDNRKKNLRVCTKDQNQRNSQKQKLYNKKKCSSQFKGVSLYKINNKFQAQIGIKNKDKNIRKSLGYFNSEIGAAQAYNVAAKYLFKDFAHFNDVPEPTGEFIRKIKNKLLRSNLL